jgi:predicted acyl esterase
VCWKENVSKITYGLKVKYNVLVPMRNGVQLFADVNLPDKDGKFLVLLMRTHYGKCNRDLCEKK